MPSWISEPNWLFVCWLWSDYKIMVTLMKVCVTNLAWNSFCGGKHMPDMWSNYIELCLFLISKVSDLKGERRVATSHHHGTLGKGICPLVFGSSDQLLIKKFLWFENSFYEKRKGCLQNQNGHNRVQKWQMGSENEYQKLCKNMVNPMFSPSWRRMGEIWSLTKIGD